MGDDVQNETGAPATVDPGHRRLVSKPSPLAGQGAARRAQEAPPGPLQLLRRERQLSQFADARRTGEAGLVQVASPSKPATAPHMGEVRRATQALSSPASPPRGPNLGDVTASHLSGRAGWWKSPCPVPARAPGEQSPGATRHAPDATGATETLSRHSHRLGPSSAQRAFRARAERSACCYLRLTGVRRRPALSRGRGAPNRSARGHSGSARARSPARGRPETAL
jgi:hypothetical protein